MKYELAIIGGGAAGFTAGIYAVRSGIKTVIFEKSFGGGLANVSPKIENYPGFESISGMDLMDKMKKHAGKYTDIHFNEEVNKIEKLKDKFKILTDKETYEAKAIVLCTGTDYRKLNTPGEKELTGKGVSYCATCDGFFFKNKKVAVVGGGNTALIESIFLKQTGCKEVYVIHRRDQLLIIVDNKQRTNIKGVYAAGDITGGLRQVVTACAEGAIAALSSTESLGKQYPY